MSTLSSGSTNKASLLLKFQEPQQDDFADDFNIDSSASVNLSFSKFSHVTSTPICKSEPAEESVHSGQLQAFSGSPFLEKIQKHVRNVEVESFPKRAMEPIAENSSLSGNFRGAFSFAPQKITIPKLREERLFENDASDPHTPGEVPFAKPHRIASVKVSLTPAQRIEKRPGLRTTNALENFKFFERVGRGAYADVYRGLNLATNQVIAIKQINLDKDYDLSVLMGEIDLLKILKHDNIVKYHGFVKTLESLNVFLEFCGGGSLRQLYKRAGHGLPESDIVSYVTPILRGLTYLHEQGVVHRDVKAANVLLTDAGEVKLADFGVATKVATSHNTVVGTPNWMAPETVLGGDGICTASDIWSLGATIIELFTMNPPYHDLNPMAALHAIGTEEHPPIPPGLSPLAKDFLLECFQKQPNLRITASLLLKHRWLSNITHHPSISKFPTEGQVTKSDSKKPSFSLNEVAEEPWEGDIENFKDSKLAHGQLRPSEVAIDLSQSNNFNAAGPKIQLSRLELLNKFSENDNDLMVDPADGIGTLTLAKSTNVEEYQLEFEEEVHDPFLEIDVENFDTNELEIQSKMELLITKLSNRAANCHNGNERVLSSLVKITGRMLQLVKKYPILHDILIRDHGILTLMELLENALEFVDQHRLWYQILAALNYIFDNHVAQIENFALLGGIPLITQFSKLSFGLPVRLQVAKFVKILRKSEKALLMFVSSGGLRILSRFLEEDFDSTPDFPLVSIQCIHEILAKDLTRFKSDMCRILAKYGVVFWFVVLLNRLTKYKPESGIMVPSEHIEATTDQILDVIKFFGQSEPRVRIIISNPDLFKLLIKVYPSLSYPRQLALLKFFRSLSCISELLRPLHSADILEFYVTILQQFTPSKPHYKEVVNIVAPSLYNCCYLNHNRETEIVKLGAVPLLRDLSRINLPFRQFVLPILCELVYCGPSVRQVLLRNDVVTTYFSLLVDPYWHSNAMDSILQWSSQDLSFNWLDYPMAKDCLVSGFMMNRVSNLEAVLENYLLLLNSKKQVVMLMMRPVVFENILTKLSAFSKNAVAKLSLLRILHCLTSSAAGQQHEFSDVFDRTKGRLTLIINDDPSVLAMDLAKKIMSSLS